MGDTAISWTHRPGTRGRTWNATKGCSQVSPGCCNCYAKHQAARIVRMSKGKPSKYDDLVRLTARGEPSWTGKVALDADTLAAPLKWREPSTVFVNSMSDLFHESLTNEQIAAVFGVMAATPRHVYQILTKRATRMRQWFEWVNPVGKAILERIATTGYPPHPRKLIEDVALQTMNGVIETIPTWRDGAWPLLNVWLGVSVENQDAADERIPELLRTPAAVRFLSCEPLLGAVVLPCHDQSMGASHSPLDQVILGAESGPGARPADPAWFRSIVEQCRAANVAVFIKQIVVGGKLRHDVREFPADLQIQEFPR